MASPPSIPHAYKRPILSTSASTPNLTTHNHNNTHTNLSPSSTSPSSPSLAAATNPPNKRRKPSLAARPSSLRQTSFPPELDPDAPAAAARSPSVESSVFVGTPSVVSGSGMVRGSKKRKRGRGKKDGAGGEEGESTVGGGGKAGSVVGSLIGGNGGNGGNGGGNAEEDGEEDDDNDGEADGDEGLATMVGGKMSEAAQKQEKEHLAMLMDAFTPEQADRYETWRRVKLRKESVRRLVNHTLSQSVPASVVTTVSGYTKILIMEMIERARDVQQEWHASSLSAVDAAATTTTKTPPSKTSDSDDKLATVKTDADADPDAKTAATTNGGTQTLAASIAAAMSASTIPAPDVSVPIKKEEQDDHAALSAPTSIDAKSAPNPPTTTTTSPLPPASSPPPTTTAANTAQPSLRTRLRAEPLGPLTPDHLREALRRYRKENPGGAAGFLGLSLKGKEVAAARSRGRRMFR